MGLSAVRRFPGIAGETKCEGDGVGRYDGLWSGEVTHRTHWPHLNLQVLNQRNSRKQKWKPLTTRRQVTDRPTKRKLFSSKNAMTFVQDGAPAQTSKWLRHGVWRICQTFIPMDDLPANSSDLNIIDETTTKIQPLKHCTSWEGDYASGEKMPTLDTLQELTRYSAPPLRKYHKK